MYKLQAILGAKIQGKFHRKDDIVVSFPLLGQNAVGPIAPTHYSNNRPIFGCWGNLDLLLINKNRAAITTPTAVTQFCIFKNPEHIVFSQILEWSDFNLMMQKVFSVDVG